MTTKRQRLKRDPMNQKRGKAKAWAAKYGAKMGEPVGRFAAGVNDWGPKGFHPDTHGRRRQRAYRAFELHNLAGHGFSR